MAQPEEDEVLLDQEQQPPIVIEGDITIVATTDITQFAKEQSQLWMQVLLGLEHLRVDDAYDRLKDSLIVACSKSAQAWAKITDPTAQF